MGDRGLNITRDSQTSSILEIHSGSLAGYQCERDMKGHHEMNSWIRIQEYRTQGLRNKYEIAVTR